MGTQNKSVLTLTVIAAGVIAAHQQVGLNRQVATAGGPVLGAAESDAASGEAFALGIMGTATGLADDPVTEGMALEVGADGALTEHDAGVIVGVALEDAADGVAFEYLQIPHGI